MGKWESSISEKKTAGTVFMENAQNLLFVTDVQLLRLEYPADGTGATALKNWMRRLLMVRLLSNYFTMKPLNKLCKKTHPSRLKSVIEEFFRVE